jgi:aspartate/methionine/tyrosine aminotransferase
VAFPVFLSKLLIRSRIAHWLPSVKRLTEGNASSLHFYSDRVLAAPHAELDEVAALLQPHGADVIDLALGTPRFDLVPSGSTKLPADRRGWPSPWGLPELRAAVAARLLADHGVAVSPGDEVLITHGAAGAFSVALDSFVNPGHRVVLFDPTSPLYPLLLHQRRARLRWVPTWMEDGRLRFRLHRLALALRGARMLVVNSPANPTGGILAAEDLEQIAWWANHHDVLIFSDEVFARYCYDSEATSIGTRRRARHRTLTAGSVSKSHALAAARVGWLAGSRHLLRACALTAGLQAAFVPTLCQQVAGTALRQDPETFEPIRRDFSTRRQYAFERLEALGLKPAWPAGGFFFWVPVGQLGLHGREFAERLLRTRRVLVAPGKHFGPSGMEYIRISYAADDGRLREGLGRLAEFVRELQGGKTSAQPRAA